MNSPNEAKQVPAMLPPSMEQVAFGRQLVASINDMRACQAALRAYLNNQKPLQAFFEEWERVPGPNEEKRLVSPDLPENWAVYDDSLAIGALIRYNRCFKNPRTHMRKLLKLLTPEEAALHEEIATMRDDHYSHDSRIYDDVKVVFQLQRERIGREILSVHFNASRLVSNGIYPYQHALPLIEKWFEIFERELAGVVLYIEEYVRKEVRLGKISLDEVYSRAAENY